MSRLFWYPFGMSSKNTKKNTQKHTHQPVAVGTNQWQWEGPISGCKNPFSFTTNRCVSRGYLENLVYNFFRQLWLVLGVKLMETNSNWFSRYLLISCHLTSCHYQSSSPRTRSERRFRTGSSFFWGGFSGADFTGANRFAKRHQLQQQGCLAPSCWYISFPPF